jgi:putative endonuclease
VFIEVKTRRTREFGFPEVSITKTKKRKLIDSALSYMQDHPELGQDWQIDVISVQQIEPDSPEIFHFKNAII